MMLQKKWFHVIVTAVVALIITAGCGSLMGPQTVKVAVSLPTNIPLGQEMLNGVQLALDEANGRAGSVAVELLVFSTSDPQGSPVSVDLEREAATQAIADPAVVAYIGSATSDQAKAALPLLNEASVTQISPTATWPGLTKPGFAPGEPGIYYPSGRRHFFRMVPSDDLQAVAAANWANQLKFKTIYILDDGSAYSQGLTGIFEIMARDIGLNIIKHDSYDPHANSLTADEYNALASHIVAAAPDLLYYGGGVTPGGSELIGTVRTLAPNIPIMGTDALIQEQLITDHDGDLVEGIRGTTVTIPASELDSAATFVTNYRDAYGKDPFPFVVTSYAAMKVVLQAIEQAEKPTREGVLNAMTELDEVSGVLGTWRFDGNGDISLTRISGMQIQDKAWSFVQVIQ